MAAVSAAVQGLQNKRRRSGAHTAEGTTQEEAQVWCLELTKCTASTFRAVDKLLATRVAARQTTLLKYTKKFAARTFYIEGPTTLKGAERFCEWYITKLHYEWHVGNKEPAASHQQAELRADSQDREEPCFEVCRHDSGTSPGIVQLRWQAGKKRSLRIHFRSLLGGKKAAERVAERLRIYVDQLVARDDMPSIMSRQNIFMAEDDAQRAGENAPERWSYFRMEYPLASDAAHREMEERIAKRIRVETELRSRCCGVVDWTCVYAKSIAPIWANDVADGKKFFECAANKMSNGKVRWSNMFKSVHPGDYFVIVETGTSLVCAVAEVSSMPFARHTDRAELMAMVPPIRRAALTEYLGDAHSFDYVTFSRVFDMRRMNMSSTDLLRHIGVQNQRMSQGLLHASKDATVHATLRVLAVKGIARAAKN
jgi:hypothetical protein